MDYRRFQLRFTTNDELTIKQQLLVLAINKRKAERSEWTIPSGDEGE